MGILKETKPTFHKDQSTFVMWCSYADFQSARSLNVKMSFSFIQLDGYEPVSVEAVAFRNKNHDMCEQIAMEAVGGADDGYREQREAVSGFLFWAVSTGLTLFLSRRAEHRYSHDFASGVYWQGGGGSGSDSYANDRLPNGILVQPRDYYFDMIESYLSIYPDGEESLMYDKELPYFYSPAFVQPRSKQYALFGGRTSRAAARCDQDRPRHVECDVR
jgi:hypothetical protein